MTDILRAYIVFSVFIGAFYFNYWYNTLQPQEVLSTTKVKRLLIYFAVIFLSTILSPVSMYDLFKYYILKRKEEKR